VKGEDFRESFVAVHKSAFGPKRRILRCNRMSAFRGIATVTSSLLAKRPACVFEAHAHLPPLAHSELSVMAGFVADVRQRREFEKRTNKLRLLTLQNFRYLAATRCSNSTAQACKRAWNRRIRRPWKIDANPMR